MCWKEKRKLVYLKLDLDTEGHLLNSVLDI